MPQITRRPRCILRNFIKFFSTDLSIYMWRGYLTACPRCNGFWLHAYQIQGKVWHCVIFHQILWIIDRHWLKKETLHCCWILSKDKYLHVLSAKFLSAKYLCPKYLSPKNCAKFTNVARMTNAVPGQNKLWGQSLNVFDESCWEENIKIIVTKTARASVQVSWKLRRWSGKYQSHCHQQTMKNKCHDNHSEACLFVFSLNLTNSLQYTIPPKFIFYDDFHKWESVN